MSDLDKMMEQLDKNKIVEKSPQETEVLKDKPVEEEVEEDEEKVQNELDQDLVEEVEDVKEDDTPIKEENKEVETPEKNEIENEVALLQNEGIFRREFLFALKELITVQKVNAEVLIDIKKALVGVKNAK